MATLKEEGYRMSGNARWTMRSAAIGGVAAVILTAGGPAAAQTERQAYAPEEIIVTARKRQESILKAPVVMSAISAAQIENMKISTMNDLAIITPGLFI